MKKEAYIIAVIEVLLLIISLLQMFVFKSFNYFVYLLVLFIVLAVVYYFLHFDRRKERLAKDVILIISIAVLLYWLVTYVIGYFSGFLLSSYQRSFFGILKNVLYGFGLIIITELLRHIVLRRRNAIDAKLLILTVIAFSFVEVATKFSLNQLDSNTQILKLMFSVVVPIFSKNVLLTYITTKTGYVSSTIYRSLMELPLYIVPIVPNLGYYIENLTITILPLIILLIIYKIYYSSDDKVVSSRMYNKLNRLSTLGYGLVVVILVVVVLLVSGVGRYIVYTIGSASMDDTISVGDVVVIDKKDKSFEEKDIIAFYHNDVILVHRIIGIYEDDYGIYYQTKGDNNDDADTWLVKENEVVGQYKLRIRWIGWPTVKLNEWLMGGD